MFLLHCNGAVEKSSQLNILSLEDSIIGKKGQPRSDDLNHVNLFGKTYLKGTLENYTDELFSLCRTFFHFLNNASRNSKLPNVPAAQYNSFSDYAFLRKSILELFIFIKNSLEDIIGEIDHFKSLLKISNLKEYLCSFRCLLGSLKSLPDFILLNYMSDSRDESLSPSFHLFHLYIELFWLNFVIEVQFKYLENSSLNEKLLETEDFDTENAFVNVQSFDSDIELEIEWFLYNLITLSSKYYDMKGSKGIFPCNCIRDIWIALQKSVYLMSEDNKCQGFWNCFNNTIVKYLLQTEDISAAKKTRNNPYYMVHIKSEKNYEFSLSLLSKLLKLNDLESLDHKFTVTTNFTILEMILKNIVNSNETIPEINMRNIMKYVIKICNSWTEPKNEIITLLWEYFHKRLNSAFSIVGQDNNFAIVQKDFYSSSISEIIVDLNLCVNMGDVSRNHIMLENSFSLFMALLGMYLKNSITLKQNNNCQKIKGRILPKFNLNKIITLNEFGLKNFSMLFLVISKATDSMDMCIKLQELVSQLPFDDLSWNKKQIIIKIHLIAIYLLTESNNSVGKACIPVKSIMNNLCNMRDSESMSLVKTTLSGYLEVLDASCEFSNDEYVLLDSWVSKYITVCNLSDLYNILDTLNNMLSKLRIFCSYQMNLGESVSSLMDAFFIHILSITKSLYSNGISALQIADLSFGFMKFILENEVHIKKYDNFENLLRYFINAENANERVVRHFLNLILQDDQVLNSLSNKYKDYQTLIIHGWFKCVLISTDELSDDDTHLMLLICQLDEFSNLNITPGYNNSEQRSLCKFFEALNKKWCDCQDANEKNNFKRKVYLYLNNLVKHISTITKSPSSSQQCLRLFTALGSLFVHCSQIIYTKADPTCLLHSLLNNVFLPPQLFMDKKQHPYVMAGICKNWYRYMTGLYILDYKSDIYVDKVMKDMIIQYLPYFTEKVLSRDIPFDTTYPMISNECSTDMILEKYILEKISSTFITCRGKQSHVHSTKALCIIYQLSKTDNINLVLIIVSCTLCAVFEQLMFADASHPNKKISEQIVNLIFNSNCNNEFLNIRNEVKEILIKACQKHLAFNSTAFFKLITNLLPIVDKQTLESFILVLKLEITKIEKMRGVGFDQGLRNGLKEVEQGIQQHKKIMN